MNKQLKHIFLYTLLCFSGILFSCVDLEIPPMNIIQDKDVLSSEAGVAIYLSRIYSQMPFEDFKYSPQRQFFDDYQVAPGTVEGSSVGRNESLAMTSEGWVRGGAYWTRAFQLLRDANRLLETFPEYKDNFNESRYNHYLGEAYFTRAIVFYALAKRYGGIPLVLEVLKYPENSAEALDIPRSTEEETWDQVLSDFDNAITRLSETSPNRGYANKYVALSFKSEAMLFAGSVAKYNRITGFGQKTGVRVIGFDPNTAEAASHKYFREAYKAAREVIKSGKYSLYKKKWAIGDREAQYQNMVDLYSDLSSPENIYIKEYKYPDLTHGYDIYNSASQFAPSNGAFNSPTLDLVELYDGIERYSDGTIKVFDKPDKDDPDRKYILFDNLTDIFKNAEPRLRAFVIFPGDVFKGEVVDIRKGVFTGDVTNGISPLVCRNKVVDYSLPTYGRYQTMDAYTGTGNFTEKVLFLSGSRTNHEVVTLPDGRKINASGACGPFHSDQYGSLTGFTIRKWLNVNIPQELMLVEARSEQHFILMRYAEILLNVAEAAAELKLAGESTVDGENLSGIAYEAIRDVRERAGADPLVSETELDGETGLLLIRKERRKELPFENKILWDIRRWRTQHSDILNGKPQSDGSYYRGLYPFYSSKANKYFFDARFEEYNKRYLLTEAQYYFAIPGGEVSKSPVIDQQPGR